MRILIVDDFDVTRTIVANTLKDLGFENIFEATNGYSALISLKSNIFDFVITEWDMSEMNGLELLKKIRADPFLKHVPVLIVTEEGLTENIVSGSKAGANDFIFKPLKKEKIYEKLLRISEII